MRYLDANGTEYTFANLHIHYNIGYVSVELGIPVDLLQIKLLEIGYEISGPSAGRTPAIIRGRSPSVTLEIVPEVRVTMRVSHIQTLIRAANCGEFDVYKKLAAKEKRGWE